MCGFPSCSHAQVFSAPGHFFSKRRSSGKKGNSRRKRRNFRSGRQQPCRWVRWDFMTLIVITLMLLLGIYQNFRKFHLEIGFLEAQCQKTQWAVGSWDWRYVKMRFHLSIILNACEINSLQGNFLTTQIERLFTWRFMSHFRFLWIHHPQEFLSVQNGKLKSVNLIAVRYSFYFSGKRKINLIHAVELEIFTFTCFQRNIYLERRVIFVRL